MKAIFLVLIPLLIISCSKIPGKNLYVVMELESKDSQWSSIVYDEKLSSKISSAQMETAFENESYNYLKQVYNMNPGAKKIPIKDNIDKNHFSLDPIYEINYSNGLMNAVFLVNSIFCNIFLESMNSTELQVYQISEIFIDQISKCVNNQLTNKNENIVFIGNDHSLSYFTIKAAKELDPNSKIGLFVFDEHVDIYGLKEENNILGKANVFGKLLHENQVDYITFMHVSEAAKEYGPESTLLNNSKEDFFRKISIYSSNDLKTPEKIIEKEIKTMKTKGINTILISFDIDALPTQYTGFEYSILGPSIARIKFGNGGRNQTLAEFENGFSKGITSKEFEEYYKLISKYSMENGISFGKIKGDVQELLPTQDIGLETTREAKQIAEIMGSN